MTQIGTEWRVSACGCNGKQHVERFQYFHRTRYEQARELYLEWLVRYSYADVELTEVPKYSYK